MPDLHPCNCILVLHESVLHLDHFSSPLLLSLFLQFPKLLHSHADCFQSPSLYIISTLILISFQYIAGTLDETLIDDKAFRFMQFE